MHQVGAGVLGPVFRGYDPQTDRTVALKSFPLDLTPEQAAEFAQELERLSSLDLNHPSLIAPRGSGLEGHLAYLVEDYFVADSIDTAIRQYGPAPAADAVRLIGQLSGALDFAAAVGVHHGALHPRDILVAPREVRMTGIGVAGALEQVGFRAASRRPYSAPERDEGGPPTLAADLYALAVIGYELLTGRRPALAGETLQVDLGSVAAAEPAALSEVFARAFSVRPEDRYPSALAFAGALKHALTAQPIEAAPAEESRTAAADTREAAGSGERARARRPRSSSKGVSAAGPDISVVRPDSSAAGPDAAAVKPATVPATADAAQGAAGPDISVVRQESSVAQPESSVARPESSPAEPPSPPPERLDDRPPTRVEEPGFTAPTTELPEPPPLALDDLDLRREEEPELPLLDRVDDVPAPAGPSALDDDETPPPPAVPGPAQTSYADLRRPEAARLSHAEPESATLANAGDDNAPPRRPLASRQPSGRSFERPVRQKRRVSGVALLLMLLFGVLLGLAAGYYFAVRQTPGEQAASSDASTPGGQVPAAQTPAGAAPGSPSSSPSASFPPVQGTGAATPPSASSFPLEGHPPGSSSPAPPSAAAPAPGSPGEASGGTREASPDRRAAGGTTSSAEGRATPRAEGRGAKSRTTPARPKAAAGRPSGAAAGAERTRRPVFEGALSVVSKPAGAQVFVDGHPVGTTPLTLPRLSAGSHVIRLERSGYSSWSAAIQVVAGEQNRVTASLEQRSSR